MSKVYNISSNPHVRNTTKTRDIMLDVIIALLPAAVFGVYNFGTKAAILIIATTLGAVFFEFVTQFLLKKEITISDMSAAVTGLLLALILPYNFPIWMALLGVFFAVVVVKQLFGGLGQNFLNPALTARCFLVLSFAAYMTNYTVDSVSGATPLTVLKNGGTLKIKDLVIGLTNGTIGETSVIALLVGALYLLIKKVISFKIPFVYIITFSIFVILFGGRGFDINFIAMHICSGGLLLGAFFMATDYATSPITSVGKVVYGIILGLLTGIFRFMSPENEGVSYAIILSNILVPLIEKITMPYALGLRREHFLGRIEYKIHKFFKRSRKGGR